MAKHVIFINDRWEHTEAPDCSCKPQVVTDKDGDLVYIHEDYSRRYRKKEKPQPNVSVNEQKVSELKAQQDTLIKIHDTLLQRALDNPKDYAGGIVQELNNGILIRLEYLGRTLSILENGSY